MSSLSIQKGYLLFCAVLESLAGGLTTAGKGMLLPEKKTGWILLGGPLAFLNII